MDTLQYDILEYLRRWAESKPSEMPALQDWAASIVESRHGSEKSSTNTEDGNRIHDWLRQEELLPVIRHLANEAKNRKLMHREDSSAALSQQMRNGFLRFARYEVLGRRVAKVLDECGVDWVMMKGYAISRRFYDQPFQRQMRDIDILVAKPNFPIALEALCDSGGQIRTKSRDTPDEKSIIFDQTEIDLHRMPMRDSRLRFDPVQQWLARAQTHGPYRYLSDHDELLISLVHPAVTEYLTMRIIRMLDILLQIARCRTPIDWPRLADDIRRLGLANAAYATGIRVNHIFATGHPPVVPVEFLKALGVDRWRKRYWHFWLDRRPDDLYKASPWLAQAVFSLWLNDSPGDWFRVAASIVGVNRENFPPALLQNSESF